MLKYYKSQQDFNDKKAPKGVINFNQICVHQIFAEKDNSITLQLKGSERTFNLRCSNGEEFNEWKRKLNHSIEASIGKKRDIAMNMYKTNINQVFDFWRFLRIPEQLVLDQAELGDIILCLKKKKFTGSSTSEVISAIESIALVVRKTDEGAT